MGLNSLPDLGSVTSPNNRVYRATQSGTYTVDIKPGVYRVTRQATTNIIIGSTTITPSTTPSLVFINTPQTSITFNSTISQDTVPWVTKTSVSITRGDVNSFIYDDYFKFYYISRKANVHDWALSTDALTWVGFTQMSLQENYMQRVNRPVRTTVSNVLIAPSEWYQAAGVPYYFVSYEGRSWAKYQPSMAITGNGYGWYIAVAGPNDRVVLGGRQTSGAWLISSNTPQSNTGWSGSVQLPNTESFVSGAYGGGMYVMGSTAGSMRISTDAITWTVANPGFGAQSIEKIAYGQGKFVAVGNTGIIRTSTNGTTWDTVDSTVPSNVNLNDVIYSEAEGIFIAIASGNGLSRISTNGVTWQDRTLPTTFSKNCILYAQGKYTILKENDTTTFTPYEVTSMLVTTPTVPFVDTYIVLESKGQIETLA